MAPKCVKCTPRPKGCLYMCLAAVLLCYCQALPPPSPHPKPQPPQSKPKGVCGWGGRVASEYFSVEKK